MFGASKTIQGCVLLLENLVVEFEPLRLDGQLYAQEQISLVCAVCAVCAKIRYHEG
jgi:hypothetical protein